MDIFLQIWAASFYLCNKALFAIAESRDEVRKRQLKIVGWAIYILGVPPWVVIMVAKNNWIAAAIEAGGIPAMLLGLFNVAKGRPSENKWLNRSVEIFTYTMIVLGAGYSWLEHGGLGQLSQWLEVGVMVGFLMGGYYMARGNANGWLFFALMNLSMGSLTLLQDKYVLAIQQSVSLCFVIYGFISAKRARG
ncbi:nicotinamide mononucleotide transporter [Oceanobacter mangrovi]|uniref:nicotinamide mononucleotide transporter n=1 Tax=Oceanobacter mangrovi TaxID=2862510 RepID=UPI001FE3C9C1|nr:nicotinamide mononucleotide transporter [Oceanobacter mangrovi]